MGFNEWGFWEKRYRIEFGYSLSWAVAFILGKEKQRLFNIPIKFFTYTYPNAKITPVGISDYILIKMVATFQLHSTFPNFIIIGDTSYRLSCR